MPAVRLLESQKLSLGCPDLKVWSLVEFNHFARSQDLTRREKELIVDQAILLIDQFYAHLSFKRARYAADPVQSLRLIRAQLDELSGLAFHDQMIQALVALRDAHTFYALPDPYQGAFAFLPFRMEGFYESPGKHHPPVRKYIVSHIMDGFEHELFTAGAEITSWNGVPTDQAVEREGQLDPGANPSSRVARSINNICARALAISLPPPESFVVVGYKPARGHPDEFGIVMPWHIVTNGIISRKRKGAKSSINESMAQVARARKILFHRQAVIDETDTSPSGQPKYPHVFSFQHSGGTETPDGVDPAALHDPSHADQKFGYIKIRTFDLDMSDEAASDKFVDEFQRIVRTMQEIAPDGLILDIRSNPGGSIQAAERILQLFTPRRIQPTDFRFVCTPGTQRIATYLSGAASQVVTPANLEWLPWVPDLLRSIITRQVTTPGQPLTRPGDANDTGQVYQGPVTLLIDALAYSATDIFAAGFQDHQIGLLIGVDENTGGGGANRWLHTELLDNLRFHGFHDLGVQELPRGAELGFAIRRCYRVGENAGTAIEDEGVKADIPYHVTKQDVLCNDRDLLAFACSQLALQPSYRLSIIKAELTSTAIDVSVTSHNLFRLECVINAHFTQYAVPVTGPQQSFQIPLSALLDPVGRLQIFGFAQVPELSGITSLKVVTTAIYLFAHAGETAATAIISASAG